LTRLCAERAPGFLFALAMAVVLPCGCSALSSTKVPTGTPVPISVTVAPPSASMQVGQSEGLTATVANDPSNLGVSWSLSGAGCSGAGCGSLSAASSASAAAVTYAAPEAVPNPASVTVTATSVADGTKMGTAAITIVAMPPAITVNLSQTGGERDGERPYELYGDRGERFREPGRSVGTGRRWLRRRHVRHTFGREQRVRRSDHLHRASERSCSACGYADRHIGFGQHKESDGCDYGDRGCADDCVEPVADDGECSGGWYGELHGDGSE
jgi:hypothetical protein